MTDVTQTNITAPPDYLAPYYEAMAKYGADAGQLGFTPYGGQRVAPLTQQQQDAASMIQARAITGSPSMTQAGDWYANMLAGKNGGSNVDPTMGPSSIAAPSQLSAISNQYLGAASPQMASSGQIGAVAAPGQIGPAAASYGPGSVAASGQIGMNAAPGQIGGVNAAYG